MRSGGGVWDTAASAAREILSSVAGEVLGWILILVVLLPVWLILYSLMKKMGYGKSACDPRTGTHSYSFRINIGSAADASANQVKPEETFVPLGGKHAPALAAASPPPQPGPVDPPDWQKEMMAGWQREVTEQRQASDRTLQNSHSALPTFYKVLVYSVATVLILAAVGCFVQASRGHTDFIILGILLLAAAAATCSRVPSES